MRFHRLRIPAFGPFTNLDLSFPKIGHDLHVIYGENEAGKSSLLRAIRGLLFGIPGRSTDNFLHNYPDLRLVGEIENREGARLTFQRRRGNKNTLLDEKGDPLPETALGPFLGSVDARYFSTMFGLGSSELREGAAQLLRGEGELGSALFSASMGGTPIQRVVESIITESEQLFKGRATTNVSIRPAAKRYDELIKLSKASIVAAEVWKQLEEEIDRRQSERDQLEKEIAGYELETNWVTRCEDALPSVGQFNGEMKLLRELPALPDVASDFVGRASSARDGVADSIRKVGDLSGQIAQLDIKLGACATSPEVLAVADELDALRQDLGAYGARKERRTTLQSRLAGIEPVLHGGMKSLGIQGDIDSLEQWRLGSAALLSVEHAAKALTEAIRERDHGEVEAEALRINIETYRGDLQLLTEIDLEPLREALAFAAEATDANKTLEISRAAVENLARKVRDEQTLVVGAPADSDSAAQLPIPSPTTIRIFRERLGKLAQDGKAASKKIREVDAKIALLREELVRLERRGALPTEESLQAARARRDHGWQLVLKDWKGSGAEEPLDPVLPLEEVFPQTIQVADQIADRLRLDADAVAQAGEKRLQILGCQETIENVRGEMDANHNVTSDCQEAWVSEWSAAGIDPRSPEEMEEWREHWTSFRETLTRLCEAEDAFQSKTQQIQKATEALAAVLKDSPTKSFAILFEAAKKQVQQGEQSTGRRNRIAEQLVTAQKELETLARKTEKYGKAIATTEAAWNAASKAVGLPTDTPPESGLTLLQERKELIAKFDQWKEWSGEANQTAEALEAYEKRVSEQATQLGVTAESTEAREGALWKLLSAARMAQAEYDQLASQIKDTKESLDSAQQKESRASQTLVELMKLAGIHSADELEPVLAGLEKRSVIQGRLDALRATLGGLARGAAVEEFIAQIEGEKVEEFPQRKARLQASKAEKEEELQTIREALSELQRKHDELANAGDAAADFRQQAESLAAKLTLDASRFVRLQLAAHFLRVQIEQFRQQNQGPLLERSGEVFKHITREAFEGLAAEFNDEDVPVLMGRRTNGTNVPVEGMSEGTRDQLYLALRLAALDRHLEHHEPMPFILDDLLSTFDNARAGAILPQLAELSKRTQIFLFTHHEHLIDLCRQNLGEGNFHLYSLGEVQRLTVISKPT